MNIKKYIKISRLTIGIGLVAIISWVIALILAFKSYSICFVCIGVTVVTGFLFFLFLNRDFSYKLVAKTHRLAYGMKATFLQLDFNIE